MVRVEGSELTSGFRVRASGFWFAWELSCGLVGGGLLPEVQPP